MDMTKFEYKTVLSQHGDNRDEEDLLNEAGQQGWELVAVSVVHGRDLENARFKDYCETYFFKRPLSETD